MLPNQTKRSSAPRDYQGSPRVCSGDAAEVSAWHLYNNHAGEMESEKVQDWKDMLNTLLVFAALYSAILTAFIIESMKLIQEDTSDTTNNILLVISQQLHDNSVSPFNATAHEFVAPPWAIRVNFCFFVSLACSLATALAAVLALQWVGSYDHGLNPSSIEGRAIQLRFRIHGAETWKLDQVIAFMPTIIFFSLLIFMAGLGVWLRNVHSLVSIVVILGAAIGTLFFGITTLISIFDVAAPFRTPVSRYLPHLTVKFIHRVLTVVSVVSKYSRKLLKYLQRVFKSENTTITDQIAPTTAKTAHKTAPVTITTTAIATVNAMNSGVPQPLRRGRFRGFIRSLNFTLSIEEREVRAIESNKSDLEPSSLFWLAESIYIESYQRKNITIVVQAILDLPRGQRLRDKDKVNLNAWNLIIKELHTPISGKIHWTSYSTDDLMQAVLLMKCLGSIGPGIFDEAGFQQLVKSFYEEYTHFPRISNILMSWRCLELESMKQEQGLTNSYVDDAINDMDGKHVALNMGNKEEPCETLLEAYQQIIKHWLELPLEFVIMTLESIRKDLKALKFKDSDILYPIASELTVNYHELLMEDTMPLQMIDLLQEIIITQLHSSSDPRLDLDGYFTAISQYIDTSRQEPDGGANPETPPVAREYDIKGALEAHQAIVRQTIARLALFRIKRPSDGPRINGIIHRIHRLVRHPTWEEISNNQSPPSPITGPQPLQPLPLLSRSLLTAMTNTNFTIWDDQNRSDTANILLTALLRKEDPGNWTTWWIEFITALQNLIDGEQKDEGRNKEETQSIVVKLGCKALDARLAEATDFLPEHIERLQHLLSDPCVRLLASLATQSTDLNLSFLPTLVDKEWTPLWKEFVEFGYRYLAKQGSMKFSFLAIFTVGCPLDFFDRVYSDHVEHLLKTPTRLLRYLAAPTLATILEHANERPDESMKTLESLSQLPNFTSQFSNMEGFRLLPKFIRGNKLYLGEVLKIIRLALIGDPENRFAINWLETTYECLLEAIGHSNIRRMVWRLAEKNAGLLKDVLQEMHKKELHLPELKASDDDLHPTIVEAASVVPESETINEAPDMEGKEFKGVLGEWSFGDKEKWGRLFDKVMGGLEKGYINEDFAWK